MHAEYRREQLPLGARVRLSDLTENPYPILNELRRLEPVSWIAEVGMWFVTRRDDVEAILLNTQTFTLEDDESLLNDIFGRTMISTDGTEHARLRQPFHPPFLPKFVRSQMLETIETRANTLLDVFIADGTADLASQWADKLALETVMGVLGLPIHDHATVRAWFTDIGAALANLQHDPVVRARGRRAATDFTNDARPHLERLRLEPDGSVLGSLSNTDLSDDEILESCRVIVFGGLETTAALMTNTLWALLRHPTQLQEILEQPKLLSSAIEETLRWEPPVQSLTRRTTRDVTVRGVNISSGETLNCMIGAANRDPETFLNPDMFDIHRVNAKEHLSFAIGKHFCLGAALARLEAEVGLRVLLARLPNVQLEPRRNDAPRGHEFRSPPELWLRWGNV